MKRAKKNEAIVKAREQIGKTQMQVALEIGKTESGYQRYEWGHAIPTVITANKIARALGTTSEKLWGYGDTKVL